MTMLHNDAMSGLPWMPSDVTPLGAASWAAATLLHAAVQRGWPRQDLRTALLVLCLRVAADDLTDAQLRDEVQAVVDLLHGSGGSFAPGN